MTAAPGTPAPPGAVAWADAGTVTFRLAGPAGRVAGVRLRQDVRVPGDQLNFHRAGDGWELTIPRPPVHRMEYLLEVHYADGSGEVMLHPGNPDSAPGAFGAKSVLEFPGYLPPGWLSAPAEPGHLDEFAIPAPALDAAIGARVWAPDTSSEPRPLLIVHDGPEYDSLASLTRYLAAGVTGGWLPPLRAALLAPGPRNPWYSANPRYARALRLEVIPALTARLPSTVRIGMGTSLGALAMLHAHCRHPGAFGALFLQSGSFFTHRLDSQERSFPYYRRVTGFVADARHGGLPPRTIPVVMTCGVIEENMGNNRLMAQALHERAYPVTLHEVPDMHNYTAWRDAFDPHLTRLLRQACR